MNGSDRTAAAWQLAADLALARTEREAAAAVARTAAVLTGAETVRIWMIDRNRGYRFAGSWPEEKRPPERPALEVTRAMVFGTPATDSAARPFRSRLVLPLAAAGRPMGAVELLEARRSGGAFSTADLPGLDDLVHAAGRSLEAIRLAAAREGSRIAAVSRLTHLFDIGRQLQTTLEPDELARVIVNRVQAAIEAEAVYLWLLDAEGENLTLAAAVGPAADEIAGWTLPLGEGAAGSAASGGEALLFDDPGALPGIEERPDAGAGLAIRSVAVAPVAATREGVLGVLEAVNKHGEAGLDDGDLTFLREIAGATALALGNARRRDAERRATDLGALLEAAQEVSASLEPSRITFTLVHKAASVIRYRRAAVGLVRGARLELSAVSGQAFVDEKAPGMAALRELLEWAAGLEEGIYVVQEDDGTIDMDRPETRERFRAYFEGTGMRSFLTVPLRDEEGSLGVLSLEAAEPYAFSERELEAATLLAVQATVAIRNAILYQQIPMIRIFQPFARRRRQLLSMRWPMRLAWVGGPALVAAALILVPLPLRIGGDAVVLPEDRLPVTAAVEGRVAQVFVREGELVTRGQILAVLDDTDYRMAEEESRAAHAVALRELSRLRAEGRTGEAAVQAARVEGLRAEVGLRESRLAETRVRAASDGVVATPRVDELVGTRLERGDVFCEVVDPARQRIEIAVNEADMGLLAGGMAVKVKLHAYPTRSFRARVERVGVAAAERDGERVFLLEARLEPPAEALRSGMTGRAKVDSGPASALRILLRRPSRWIWSLVWGWLP